MAEGVQLEVTVAHEGATAALGAVKDGLVAVGKAAADTGPFQAMRAAVEAIGETALRVGRSVKEGFVDGLIKGIKEAQAELDKENADALSKYRDTLSKQREASEKNKEGHKEDAESFAKVFGEAFEKVGHQAEGFGETFLKAIENPVSAAQSLAPKLLEYLGPIGIAAGVTSAAIIGIGAAIVKMGSEGSDIASVEDSFKRLSGGVGQAEEALVKMREGSRGQVTDLNLMKNANALFEAGVRVTADQLKAMQAAAYTLSQDGLHPMETVTNMVTRAMETGNTTRLAMIGISINARAAEDEYRKSHGLYRDELTRTMVLEAHRQAIVEALIAKVEEAGPIELSFGERIKATGVAIKNWTEELFKAVGTSESVKSALATLSDAWSRAFSGTGEEILKGIVASIDAFADGVKAAAPYLVAFVEGVRSAWEWLTQLRDRIQAAQESLAGEIWDRARAGVEAVAKMFQVWWDSIQRVVAAIAPLVSHLAGSEWKLFGEVLNLLATAFGVIAPLLERVYEGFQRIIEPISSAAWRVLFSTAEAIVAVFTRLVEWATKAVEIFGTVVNGLGLVSGAMRVIEAVAWPVVKIFEGLAAAITKVMDGITWLAGHSQNDAFNKFGGDFSSLGAHVTVVDEKLDHLGKTGEHTFGLLGTGAKTSGDDMSAHAKAVENLHEKLTGTSAQARVVIDEFKNLSEAQRNNIDVQNILLPMVTKLLETNQKLPQSLIEWREQALASRDVQMDLGVELLKQSGLTQDYIGYLKKHGQSEAEIAASYGVTTAALKRYEDQLKETAAAELASMRDELQSMQTRAALTTKTLADDLAISQQRQAIAVAELTAKAQETGNWDSYDREKTAIVRRGNDERAILTYNAAQKEIQTQQALEDKILAAEEAGWEKSLENQQLAYDRQERNEIAAVERSTATEESKQRQIAAIQERYRILNDNAVRAADARELAQEEALQDRLAQVMTQGRQKGLTRTLEVIDEQYSKELAALARTETNWDNHWRKEYLIYQRYAEQRRFAIEEDERQTGETILRINQDITAEEYDIQYDGVQKELALNEIRRQEARRTLEYRLQLLRELSYQGEEVNQQEYEDISRTLAAIDSLYAEHARKIVVTSDPLYKELKDFNRDLRDDFADTWSKALEGEISWAEAALKPFQDLQSGVKRIFAALLGDLENQLLAPFIASARQAIGGLANSIGGAFGGGGSFGGGSNLTGSLAGAIGSGGGYQFGGPNWQGPVQAGAGAESTAGSGFNWSGVARASAGIGGEYAASLFNTGPSASTASLIGSQATRFAGYGTMIAPGLGTAIGAGVGAIVGWIQSGQEWRKVARDVARDFEDVHGQAIQVSEDFAKMIEQVESTERLGRVQALTLKIDQLIAQGGGLTPSNLDRWTAKIRDAFSYVQTGQMTAAQATAVMDANFQNLVKVGTDAMGRLSNSVKELIVLDAQFGTQSKEIAAYVIAQANQALAGTANIIASYSAHFQHFAEVRTALDQAQAAVDKLTESGQTTGQAWQQASAALDLAKARQAALVDEIPHSKEELEALGTIVVATFAAAVASGTSTNDALKQIAPQVGALAEAYKNLGIPIDDVALKSLVMQATITDANPRLVAGIDALTKSMISLDNIAALTPETFSAMQRAGQTLYEDLYNAAVRAGLGAGVGGEASKQALSMMMTYLQQTKKSADDLGVAVDANTQGLIDQAKDMGIWSEATEKAKGPVDKLVDAIQKLIDKLSGIPSKVTTEIKTVYTSEGAPPPEGVAASSGGIVPQYLARGGEVEFRPIQFRSIGTDTVPAMLTPGEGIISTGGMISFEKIGREIADMVAMTPKLVAQLATSIAGSQPSVNVTVNVEGSVLTEQNLLSKIRQNIADTVLMARGLPLGARV